MAQSRPDPAQIEAHVRVSDGCVANARATRKRYARRVTPQRDPALRDARDSCMTAAEPLRSWLGMVAWGGIDLDDELAMKGAMDRLRYERRQIDKMLS